jgi:uncharacterized repeat protein (TIGR03843 family)
LGLTGTRGEALRLLTEGDLKLHGLLPRASNYTFLGEVSLDGISALVVYKPREGETPLWDFPDGTLCLREVAAYCVSEALGWGIVPMTLLRDGPHGIGAVQLFVEHDPSLHYLSLGPSSQYADEFRRIAAFDVVTNNGDRKSGHCLVSTDGGPIFVVDHGVSFHAEPKLRTVIWDYAGEPVPEKLAADLRALGAALPKELNALLAPEEIEAMRERIDDFLESGVFPHPDGRYAYPWPPV